MVYNSNELLFFFLSENVPFELSGPSEHNIRLDKPFGDDICICYLKQHVKIDRR